MRPGPRCAYPAAGVVEGGCSLHGAAVLVEGYDATGSGAAVAGMVDVAAPGAGCQRGCGTGDRDPPASSPLLTAVFSRRSAACPSSGRQVRPGGDKARVVGARRSLFVALAQRPPARQHRDTTGGAWRAISSVTNDPGAEPRAFSFERYPR